MLAGNAKHFKVKAEQAAFEVILAKARNGKILQTKLQRRPAIDTFFVFLKLV
jgi:hypothetical protein